MIDKNISIEQLLEIFPPSAVFLSKKGIRCVICGEPIWGTLEEAAKEKNFSDADIEAVIDELNEMMREGSKHEN